MSVNNNDNSTKDTTNYNNLYDIHDLNLEDEEDDGIEFLTDDNNDSDDIYFEYDEDYDKEQEVKQSQKSSLKAELISNIKIFLSACIIAFLFSHFVIMNAQVPTGSMISTIMEGDRLIGFRLSYLFNDPKRGDIVIFKYPDNEKENYVKRIIGVPGDVIQIENNIVYVNGEAIDEPYLYEPMTGNIASRTYIVPEDCYFMMGDNRNGSFDSRMWTNTYVSRDKILAKVIFRYYSGAENKLSFKLYN